MASSSTTASTQDSAIVATPSGCHIDDEALVIVPTETEELVAFPSETPGVRPSDEPRAPSMEPIAAASTALNVAVERPSLPRAPIEWRTQSRTAGRWIVLALMALALWPHDRSIATADRARAWTALAAPLDPQLVTPNPVAERDIQRTLNVYRDAIGVLDMETVKGVWPSVDELALGDRFAAVHDQNLDYSYCDIAVTSTGAQALCKGTLTVVGSARPRRRSWQAREWRFTLRKQSTGWAITRVDIVERDGTIVAAFY